VTQTKTAVFDLDDTLSNLKEAIMPVMIQKSGINVHWSEWRSHNIDKTYGLTTPQFFDMIREHQIFENSKPLERAKEVVKQLKYDGFNIVIVTARGWHERGKEVSENWLTNNGIPFDEVFVTDLNQNKTEVLDHLDSVEFVVDDRYKNCLDFLLSGKVKRTFLVDSPWNRADHQRHPDIIRITSLDEIREILYEGYYEGQSSSIG
jgi:5'(3')-deoxyribonucleotidase